MTHTVYLSGYIMVLNESRKTEEKMEKQHNHLHWHNLGLDSARQKMMAVLATSICQMAIHLFILEKRKRSCNGSVISNLVCHRFDQWEQLSGLSLEWILFVTWRSLKSEGQSIHCVAFNSLFMPRAFWNYSKAWVAEPWNMPYTSALRISHKRVIQLLFA